MSKKEVLAALIYEVGLYFTSDPSARFDACKRAILEYNNTPDDPPQPQEMPECAKELAESVCNSSLAPEKWRRLANKIYAQPLKLEVGKVYEDADGHKTEIVYERIGRTFRFLGVDSASGRDTHWFNQSGKHSSGIGCHNLIREAPG